MISCKNCKKEKPKEGFYKSTKYQNGVQLWCISCANIHSAYRMRKKHALKQDVPFEIPFRQYYELRKATEKCPITGESFRSEGTGNGKDSATLDKINPKLGYVSGNIAFISRRANSIKNDISSLEEAKAIFGNILKYLGENNVG